MLRNFICSFIYLISISLNAQVTTEPAFPSANNAVKIIFDATKGSGGLKDYTEDVYVHAGVITDKSTSGSDWKYVVANWGTNVDKAKLTRKSTNIYELEITPDIQSYYGVPANEKIQKMAFVFRNADGSRTGKASGEKDIFVDVYQEDLNINITSPANNTIFTSLQKINISANSSQEANLKIFAGETLLKETTGKAISTENSFSEIGEYYLIAEANSTKTVRDSIKIIVRPEVIEQTKPENYKKGINYTSDNSVALVLWAPQKEFVYAIGDFNNWEISNDFLMKKDGDYFWIEISNLSKGKEYAFQYFIDGKLKIADPYTEKILDPWNDKYIPKETYPDLKKYPEGKTEGIVSVLQTGQEPYQWQITNFKMPEKEKMVIYELLIRDFTSQHSYASVIEKLDYLKDLQINVLELLPINEFEGNNSWGYNPSFYFAPDKYYGPSNELKRLIDECHKRGIAVVIDMVLNHSYGQSPFAQMYMENWVIQANNPWYNIASPNPVYSWGYDFNHESKATEELVDSINAFWMQNYKIDGFRFDFTKGFTNTAGDGSAYDMARIQNLKRMANEIWSRNPNALVILEHLAGNTEEMVLANHGMLLWGNMNHEYAEGAMAYNSDLSRVLHSSRGWREANLIGYMESHDEERLVYKCKNYGKSTENYNVKDLTTALDRIALNAVFFIPLPGPKMIWQFGEFGYDYSINTCKDGINNREGCRTSPKPILWNYLDEKDRTDLFRIMAKLIRLKQAYDEFSSETIEHNLSSDIKWYKLSHNNKHVVSIGNFAAQNKNISLSFPSAGKYYEFFSGDSINITSTKQSFAFKPGEYRLYSTRKFTIPKINTSVGETFGKSKESIHLFPNPSSSAVNISSSALINKIEVYNLSGQLILQTYPFATTAKINTKNLHAGNYFVKIYQKNKSISKKLIVK